MLEMSYRDGNICTCTLRKETDKSILGKKLENTWGRGLVITIPKSPRLCLLRDHTDLPKVSKYDLAIIKVGVITAARVILRLWKSRPPPPPRI